MFKFDMQNFISPYMLNPYNADDRKKLVGEKLSMIRKIANLTQKEVCEIINITPQTYSGYEKGKHEPSMETLVRLSLLYNVTIDYMLCKNLIHDDDDDALDYLESIEDNEHLKELSVEVSILKHELKQLKQHFNISE